MKKGENGPVEDRAEKKGKDRTARSNIGRGETSASTCNESNGEKEDWGGWLEGGEFTRDGFKGSLGSQAESEKAGLTTGPLRNKGRREGDGRMGGGESRESRS